MGFFKPFFRVVPLHGACYRADGRTVVILGSPGAGKSSLLLESLLNRGGAYLSDEITFMDREGFVHPYLRKTYVYRRNFEDFPMLYRRLNARSLKFSHAGASLALRFLRVLNFRKILKRMEVRLGLPLSTHPGELGRLCREKSKASGIVLLAGGTQEEHGDPREILMKNFTELWLERNLLHLGLPVYSMHRNVRMMEAIFTDYRSLIEDILQRVGIVRVHTQSFCSVKKLNDHIMKSLSPES